MRDEILITELNDFIFCPASIYFHHLYGDMEKMVYQSTDQINGTNAHQSVDAGTYSSKKDVLMGIDVFCEEFRLIGKIDVYFAKEHLLRERKKKIVRIYDGYVFQLYAHYFALREMGYEVERIEFLSLDDNKKYPIKLPEEDAAMYEKFCNTISEMRNFQLEKFQQSNPEKCLRCIYEPACDRAVY